VCIILPANCRRFAIKCKAVQSHNCYQSISFYLDAEMQFPRLWHSPLCEITCRLRLINKIKFIFLYLRIINEIAFAENVHLN
jgi:hypothetical protein